MSAKIPIRVIKWKPKPRPFSKLKKQIENLFDPSIKMEFNCFAYPMRSTTGNASASIPRFFLKMDKEILWDYPVDFPVKDIPYGYWAGNNGISDLVREYIDTPVAELLEKDFTLGIEVELERSIVYTLTDLFKAADRRIGKEKLVQWSPKLKNYVAYRVVCARLYGLEGLINNP